MNDNEQELVEEEIIEGPTEEEQNRIDKIGIIENEIYYLRKKLEETDYISNKLAEATAEYIVNGDSTEIIVLRTNYKEILEKRAEYRKRINDLQMELESVGGLDDN